MAKTEKKNKEQIYLNPSRFEIYCEKLHINPNLLMLKITLFMMYGATGSLLPFLTIHMQSIGLTVEEIAIIYLALPLTTFLSPPVTGFLVDKFGHYKPVVLISLILNMVFHHTLMMIPQKEIPGEIPSAYVMRHPNTTKVEVWWSPCPSRECPDDEKLSLVLNECLDHCLLLPRKNETNIILKGVHESIAARPPSLICNGNTPGCKSLSNNAYNNEQGLQFGKSTENDLVFDINRKKPKRNGTSTKKMKVSNMTGIPLELTNSSTATMEVHNSTSGTNYKLLVDMHPSLMDPSENLGMEMEPDDEEEVTDFRQHFSRELLEDEGVNYTALEEEDLRCGGLIMSSNLTYDTLKELAADCMLQKCKFRAGGPDVCPPDFKQSSPHVFWLYFLLRFLGNTMMSASVTVMDPIALDMINRYGGEFGRERLFSTIGMAIFSPLTGVLIDYRSQKLGYTDYSSAFYTYDTLLITSTLALLLMRIGAKVPADNIMRDMLRLIRLPHIIMFIFFLFALGNAWGFIESFLFLYLKELGASNYLLGITVAVGTISSIPFLYGAESITRKIGHVNIIVVAFFAHAARLMGYSYIENAWWCLTFEAIEAVSVHLLWVAAATYCARIAPKSLLATLIGVIGMAHFSLGRGSGSFAGGFLIGSFGIRQTFRLMGLMSVICGAVYGLLYFFWLHKYDSPSKDYSEDSTDQGEGEKLNKDESDKEAARKEQIQNAERLSLMIRFNHRGSLTSLDHGSRPDLRRTSSCRRGSALELGRVPQNKASSSSKVDLLKSTLEINFHKNSNPQLNHTAPPPPLTRHTTKVNNEPAVLNTPQTSRKSQKNSPPIVDELRNRRDSIPEEEEASEELMQKTENIKANLKSADSKLQETNKDA